MTEKDQKFIKFFDDYNPKEYEVYLKKGLPQSAIDIVDFLGSLGKIEENIYLDIGSGTGILSFELLKSGAKKVIGVDLSPKSIEVANKHSEENDLNTKSSFITASYNDKDFLINDPINGVGIHRVLCCISEGQMTTMINKATSSSDTKRISVTILPGNLIVRIIAAPILWIVSKFSGFKNYTHNHSKIIQLMSTNNFQLISKKRSSGIWYTLNFERNF